MKKLVILLLCAFLATSLHAQFNTSFQFGIGTMGTQFAYKAGKFNPYVGLGISNSINGSHIIIGIDTIDSRSSDSNIGIDLGLKYAVYEGEKVTAWMDLRLEKDFRVDKDFVNGELIENDETKYNYWGGGIGFQVEYFFNEQISLGTSFRVGMRLSQMMSEEVLRDRYTINSTFQMNTQSFLVLNFYF